MARRASDQDNGTGQADDRATRSTGYPAATPGPVRQPARTPPPGSTRRRAGSPVRIEDLARPASIAARPAGPGQDVPGLEMTSRLTGKSALVRPAATQDAAKRTPQIERGPALVMTITRP